jgi:hypothetical protein
MLYLLLLAISDGSIARNARIFRAPVLFVWSITLHGMCCLSVPFFLNRENGFIYELTAALSIAFLV